MQVVIVVVCVLPDDPGYKRFAPLLPKHTLFNTEKFPKTQLSACV